MTFYVGQKVVRVPVSDEVRKSTSPYLKDKATNGTPEIGGVYTIRAINIWPSKTILRFQEFDYSHLIGVGLVHIEPGWNSLGFRPIVERRTDISIFTKMLGPRMKRLSPAE